MKHGFYCVTGLHSVSAGLGISEAFETTQLPVAAGAACDRLRSSRQGFEIAEGPAALIAASCLGSGYRAALITCSRWRSLRSAAQQSTGF